jgi:hypothetical protein
MKLNLLFIAMELLTLLAYPIVFVHGRLRLFARSKESTLARTGRDLIVAAPVTPGK